MCRRGKTNSQLRKKPPRLQHQGHDLASMLLLRWSKLQTVIQQGDLSPLWLFIPIFTSHSHLLISKFNITYSFSSVSCGTLVLTQRVIWLMFNGVMLALLTSSTQLSRVLAPNSWAANGQLTNLNHRLGRVCWPNFTCKLVCLFFRLQIAGGEPEVSKSQCMWPQRSV